VKTETSHLTLKVFGLDEISAANAISIKTKIKEALSQEDTQIDFDLSATNFIDSSGLGVLISLHKEMVSRKGTLRILNPTKSVDQILELTRLNRLFEIIKP
jgi:anti-sigma B factor antagonist